MNLAQLRALVAVADQASFTGAAAALGLTQSAVSHTVASLEKELAVPLVLRRRGGTILTSHGQQVLRHAREAVHRVDRIAQDCAVLAGRHRGRLRVAAFPSAAQLLPRLIAELARCQPEVTVVLLEGTDAEVRDWLRDRVIDLGVVAELGTGDQPSSPAPGALLAQDQMVAVVDRGHPLAGQPAVALDDLVDDAFLLSDGGCEPLLHQMHQSAGLRLQPARRVRDMATLLALGRKWPERCWAVEGCQGVGRHLAQRLVADGEADVDVPAKLSARARVFSTGQGRKTDVTDAHSVAVVALRTPGLRAVQVDNATVAIRLLADRRDELGAARTLTVNRLHRLLVELIPGGAKKFLSAPQAKALLATVRPRDVVGKTRRQLAVELVGELEATDKKIKAAKKQLTELVEATDSTLLELNGIGPSGAARLIGDIGDVARFPTRGHFASWNGTAPIDASSGEQNRHRLSRAGNRRINRVLHIMAIVQLRNDTEGRA